MTNATELEFVKKMKIEAKKSKASIFSIFNKIFKKEKIAAHFKWRVRAWIQIEAYRLHIVKDKHCMLHLLELTKEQILALLEGIEKDIEERRLSYD